MMGLVSSILNSPVSFLQTVINGLEVMERKRAHHLLLDSLAPYCDGDSLEDMRTRLDDHLLLPQDEKESGMLDIFPRWRRL